MTNLDAKTIKRAVASHMQEIAEYLLPNGQRENQQWTCGSVDGEPGHSLKLELFGEKAGLWIDFAAERGGDICDLWQQVRNVDFTTALEEMYQFLKDRSRRDAAPSINNASKHMNKSKNKNRPRARMKVEPTHAWPYRNDAHEIVGKVVRWDSIDGKDKDVKLFFKPDGNGGFLPGLPEELKEDRPLYGDWPDENGNIVITEGEKAADAVRQIGYPACTSLGGCNAAEKADWNRLQTARHVLIWADSDKPGRKYADVVARLVHAVTPEAEIRMLEYGKDGQDAADFVYAGLAELGWIWDGYEQAPEIKQLAEPFKALAATAKKWNPPAPPRKKPNKQRTRQGSLILESFDKVDAEKVRWIWDGKIAEGKLNLLTGEPDTGKTNVGCFIVSTITTGNCWPFSQEAPKPGHVLVLSSEDGTSDTLLPRMMAYGADLSHIHRIKAVTAGTGSDNEESAEVDRLTTTELIRSLRESIPESGNVRLIFIDPLSAYLDVRNAHSEAEIRSALEPLADFAEEYGIAILAVAHVNKSSTDNAMDKISGSKGVVAQARTCYMAIKASPELGETDNYFANVKNNLAPAEASEGLTYRIETAIVRTPAGEAIETSKVLWTGTCSEKASQILKKRSKDMGHKQLIAAERWLVEFLQDGPRPAVEVRKAAAADGLSDRTVDRARQDLGFTSRRIGFGGNTIWFNKNQNVRFEELLADGTPPDEALAKMVQESPREFAVPDIAQLQKLFVPAIP